jgi:hypothetical protein
MDELKRAAALLGKKGGAKGGKAQVPKGFSMMERTRRQKIAKKAARKRWASERSRQKESAA